MTLCAYFDIDDAGHSTHCTADALPGAFDCGSPGATVCEAHECRCSRAKRSATPLDPIAALSAEHEAAKRKARQRSAEADELWFQANLIGDRLVEARQKKRGEEAA